MLFDSSNEASWCTDCNAKNQNSFRWTVLEKIRLDRQKGPKKLDPNCSFSWFFSKLFMFIRCLKAYMKCLDPLSSTILLDLFDGQVSFFQERSIEMSSSFFALQSVHQDASFELSNSTIRWFSIFTLVRGDPFDLGGVWALPQGDGLVKNRFQSVFLGPYGIPHPYKYQAKKCLHFSFLATAILFGPLAVCFAHSAGINWRGDADSW